MRSGTTRFSSNQSINNANISKHEKSSFIYNPLLIAQVSLFAQGVQATLANGSTASQVMIRLKNATGAALSGSLSSFTVGIRIPDQGTNPSLQLTGQNGTTINGSASPVSAVVSNGFAYYRIAVNYLGQAFPMAVNEQKDILALAFYSTGGTATVIPSVEMVDFANGGPGPNGTNGQMEYYFSIGGLDLTDASVSFYSLPGTTTTMSNSGDPKTVAIGSTPLPVTWLDFVAARSGDQAVLNWATATEKGNAGFDIERSADGKTFNKIGFVNTLAAEGNSNEKLAYTFTDSKPLNGMNHYRLKQINTDGKSSLSITRAVMFGTAAAIQMYPNPANGSSLRVTGANISNIGVYNIAGQLIHVPVTYGTTENELNISGLSSGNYFGAGNNGRQSKQL